MAEESQQPAKLRRPAVDVKMLEDGSIILRCPYDLPDPPANVGTWLRRWAAEAPDRLFISKYAGDGQWHGLNYGDAYKHLQPLAQNLIKRKLSTKRPLMILSKNGIENALLQLAAMDVGVPAIHLSPSLSLDAKKQDVLRKILGETKPGLVFAADGEPFAEALGIAHEQGAEIVVDSQPPSNVPVTAFHKLIKAWRTGGARKAYETVGGETIGKLHFKGNTPADISGVVSYQAAMCGNQEALAQIIPHLSARPPIIVDDAPWYRASTGALVFNLVLRNGGTLYIDRFGLENRVDDFTSPSPTVHITELVALYSLLPRLEEDEILCNAFFRQLELIWVIGGAATDDAKARLNKMAVAETGGEIPIIASFSSPNTSSVNTLLYFDSEMSGNIGLPLPGSFVKLATAGDSWELRVKPHGPGPQVWRDQQADALETDEDGFFPTGDLVELIDPMRPYLGIVRTGRLGD